jgi:hypothetical protein
VPHPALVLQILTYAIKASLTGFPAFLARHQNAVAANVDKIFFAESQKCEKKFCAGRKHIRDSLTFHSI